MTMARPGMSTLRWPAVALAVSLLFAACGERGSAPPKSAAATDPGTRAVRIAVPAIDPKAPFPAMSAGVLEALGADVPELARRRDAILAAERAAIQGAFDDLRRKPARAKGKSSAAALDRFASLVAGILDSLVPVAWGADEGAVFGFEQFGLGHQVATMIGGGTANVDASRSGTKEVTVPGTDGRVMVSLTLSAEAGKPVSGTIETTLAFPQFLLEANSKASIVGGICPAPDGKVEFTVRVGSKGRAGSGGSTVYDQNLEVRVTAQVGEDANVVDADFDAKQATRSTTGGRQAYLESSASARAPGGRFGDRGIELTDAKWLRTSSQATNAEVPLANENLARAVMLGYGALEGAREHWQGGNCIKIRAASPGRVSPGATSRIPVAVNHAKDGSSVPAKVTVELAGGKSVAPAVIPKAPGEVTHVAQDARRGKMTLTLTATSRRGKDKAKLEISTGQAFSIEGGLDDFHGKGTICDLAAPFTVEGGGNVVKFAPTSEKGGTYTYSGNMSGFGVFGNGTYTVHYRGDVPVGITATGPGSVKTPMGTHTKVDTEKYTLSSYNGGSCP